MRAIVVTAVIRRRCVGISRLQNIRMAAEREPVKANVPRRGKPMAVHNAIRSNLPENELIRLTAKGGMTADRQPNAVAKK